MRTWFVSCVSFCWFFFSPLSLSQISFDLESAKKQGLILYNMSLGKQVNNQAAPLIEVAAKAGDPESQYYMGEIERQKSMFMTSEAQLWYQKAAGQGDIYSMLRLATADNKLCQLLKNCGLAVKTSEEWADSARILGEQRASQRNGEAMFQLYLLTGDLDWLVKSTDAGFPEGQDWLAVQYQEGAGFFLIPGKRDEEIERLFRAAAHAGYVPAMGNLAMYLLSKKDLVGAGNWIKAAAEHGHFGAVSSYGAWSAHAPDRVGLPLDLVKAYGLIYLLAEAEPGAYGYGERKLKKISDMMSDEQIEAGKAFAEEWKKTHPPLSRFLPKYGF
ncbi:hypothetical protein AFK24_20225 [Pseudomonas syringae]|uniref:Sel1 repeat family protein n=1 Tax=Pseudomonas syringae TaxID=317 RepID=A0A1C7Z4G9_PSESX|nr:sel1 repeat family protein [Pseudomonas syringae]OCR23428.1 hypothetical protein AFK24_20225 [Pseudomonas syringae]